jgi:hypothetical protein
VESRCSIPPQSMGGLGDSHHSAQAGFGPLRAICEAPRWDGGGNAAGIREGHAAAIGSEVHQGNTAWGAVPLLRPSLAKDSGGQTGKVGSGSAARDVPPAGVWRGEDRLGVNRRGRETLLRDLDASGGGHSGGTSQNTILHLQSGHGTATSSMGYVDPVDPRMLYQTAAAILGLGASSPGKMRL